jgi:hypothetical protein
MSPKQDAVLWAAISDALEELELDGATDTPEQVTDWLGRHRPQVKLEAWLKADRGGQAAILAERRWWRWARVYLKTAGNRTNARFDSSL